MPRASELLNAVREHVRRENAHDLGAIMDTFGEKARYDDAPWDDHRLGHAAVQEYYKELLTALPDLEIVIEHELASENGVVIEVRIRGTHRGDWRGLPATERRVDFPLCGVFSLDAGGKLAGERIYYDRAMVLGQLGLHRDPRSIFGKLEMLISHPLAILGAVLRKLLRSG